MDWPSVARRKCAVELLTLIVAGVELLLEMSMRCAIVSSVAFRCGLDSSPMGSPRINARPRVRAGSRWMTC